MRTIDKIITKVNVEFGAPMGRPNIGEKPPKGVKIFNCKVPLSEGYDGGGVYWGFPNNLRVAYTKDLSYVKFYRVE